MPADDTDYVRVMNFVWELLDEREILDKAEEQWVK